MSNSTHPDLLFRDRWSHPYVGGDQNSDPEFRQRQYQEQKKVLERMEEEIQRQSDPMDLTSEDPKDPYDPYYEYQRKQGLLARPEQKQSQLISHKINIDSRHRNKKPIVDLSETYILEPNPLYFTQNSNQVFVQIPDHNFSITDKFTMTGVLGSVVTARMNFSRRQDDNSMKSMNLFEFQTDSSLIRINHPHGLTLDSEAHGEVEIAGVKGNINNSYLENLPINILNQKHTIILPDSTETTHTPFMETELDEIDLLPSGDQAAALQALRESFFFIETGIPFLGDFQPKNYNIRLTFLSAGGVPLNCLNAEFPIDVNHLNGFHIVTQTSDQGIYFEMLENMPSVTGWAGGRAITVGMIQQITSAYDNPSQYNISLEKNYYSVVSARLLSSEFTNNEHVIRNTPTELANNKIYWQNLDDGDHIYSVEIEPGNYNPEELVTVVEKAFTEVSRISDSSTNKYIAPHTQNHFIQLAIDTRTDVVTFRSFRESVLSKPVVDIYPDIQEDPNLDPDFDTLGIENFKITIEHKNHRLSVGDTILIKSAISHMGIPSAVLNQEHTIAEIVSLDRYSINISRFNLSAQRYNTGGGVSVTIYTPSQFKLRFDYPDTLGSILGFRNPGEPESITNYSTVISNKDLYAFDTMMTSMGTMADLTHNAINLSGETYILMVIEQFQQRGYHIRDVGPVKQAFAKILLTDIPGNTLFNTFVPSTSVFPEPIPHLSELDISLRTADGNLYDFNGVDHSFTLELVTLEESPAGSGISAQSGRLLKEVQDEKFRFRTDS